MSTTRKRVRETDESRSENFNNNWKNEFNNLIRMDNPIDDLDEQIIIKNNERCDASKLKTGSLVYRPAKIEILGESNNCFSVRNQDIFKVDQKTSDWTLGKELISNQCWSPDQYTNIEKITMTEMARIIKEVIGDCICKIEFTKNPDANEMANIICKGSKLIESSDSNENEKKKLYKKLYEKTTIGEYRIIRGYILRNEGDLKTKETETGMIKFLDAELMGKNEYAERIINLRNVKSVTFMLTKYILK